MSTYHIAWNQDRTVGVICEEPQLAYELRRGALNSLGIVTGDFIEAWAEMTADDNCTTQSVELDRKDSEPPVLKWIVMWINHQYESTWEVFDTEDAARTFIEKERPNIQFLYRGELVEEFNGAVEESRG